MRQATRLLALIALGAIAYASVPVQAAAGRGSIRGVVMDASGSPLVGAAVVVLPDTEAEKADKVVRRASTDSEGKFTAAGIVPGRYRVKAEVSHRGRAFRRVAGWLSDSGLLDTPRSDDRIVTTAD